MYIEKLISKVNQLTLYFSHKWLLILLVWIYSTVII
nr:MAG TPA: amino acid transporter [Caudoviricetes sp.]